MVNQQLLDCIKRQLQKGINSEQIKQSLLADGWQNTDIKEAFNTISQTPTRPKKRRWKKIVLIIVGIIILLIVVILSLPRFLNLFAKDIAPIDDSDLQLQKVSVLDKDNSYFDLTKLDNVIYEPKDKSQTILDMVAGKTWDDQVAEEIVARNTQAFEYFSEATYKPKYQNPESADPANITYDTVLTLTDSWRHMARLSAIRALYLARQGKDKEAFDEALNSVNIGQKIQESQAILIDYLIAISMKGIALDTIQKIIPSTKLGSSDLKQYAQGLNQYYKNESGLITSFKAEYHFISQAIDSIASGNSNSLNYTFGETESQIPLISKKNKNNYYFQPNETKLFFAEAARADIKSATMLCGEIETPRIQELAPTNPAELYIEENAIGKILHDNMALSYTSVSIKKCQEDLLVGATQAMIAIKAYKNDTNNYPVLLNELVPSYLSSVPQDPYDGKSLKYSAEKKILYSVGSDMQDSGGSAGDDWKKMTDPTFIINF